MNDRHRGTSRIETRRGADSHHRSTCARQVHPERRSPGHTEPQADVGMEPRQSAGKPDSSPLQTREAVHRYSTRERSDSSNEPPEPNNRKGCQTVSRMALRLAGPQGASSTAEGQAAQPEARTKGRSPRTLDRSVQSRAHRRHQSVIDSSSTLPCIEPTRASHSNKLITKYLKWPATTCGRQDCRPTSMSTWGQMEQPSLGRTDSRFGDSGMGL